MATPESPDHQFPDIPKRSVKETLERLASTQDGLSIEEARQRLGQFGPNVLTAPGSYSPLPAFIRQFTHFLAGLLWMAALLAFVAHYLRPEEGMATLGWAIVGVILIN